MEKFCKECAFYKRHSIAPRCINPEVVGRDRVTGKIIDAACSAVRIGNNDCGLEGKHWTRKRSVLERLRDKRREVVQRLDERY